jgi:hypothetical protein
MLTRMLLVALSTLALSAAAAAQDAGGQTIVRPRTFTIPANQCPSLPAGLAIQGQGTERTTIAIGGDADDDGDAAVFRLNTRIVGTASDSAGGEYRFDYRLRVRSLEDDPAHGVAVDTFRLRGRGAADGLATLIRLNVTFDASFNPIAFDIVETAGNPFLCDPL